jgi:hypothetical protein
MNKDQILTNFQCERYAHHNNKRIEHLNSLGILRSGLTVLEVGAGVGDHTGNLINHGCTVTSTEARAYNLEILRAKFPSIECGLLNLDEPDGFDHKYDLIYCYGTLYHLSKPKEAISFMAARSESIVIETCVMYGPDSKFILCDEPDNPTQSFSGHGCRPTRRWVFDELKRYWKFVYTTRVQPNHIEFPTDWTKETDSCLHRAVFFASNTPAPGSEFIDFLGDTQQKFSKS